LNLHVLHIVRDLDAISGGPSRSIPALAEAKAQLPGLSVSVVYGTRGNTLVRLEKGGARYVPVAGNPSEYLENAFDASVATILHLHGLWDPLLHRSVRFAIRRGLPYVVSTRGMLADWALSHKALRKRAGWWLYQRRDLEQSECLVASSPFEERAVRRKMPGKRVEVVPNGCHERPAIGDIEAEPRLDPEKRWALALGRLHPIKGYAELLDAWSRVQPQNWMLAIAGPDEDGYREVLQQKIRSTNLEEQVVLLGEVDDAAKWPLLDQCELFLAPSHTENFGMAIAEALQSGKPVLTTRGTPWQELHQHECGWWVEPVGQAIEKALRQATELPPGILREMGARGRNLIRDKYTWGAVAKRTMEIYQSILSTREL
jgi:glycosyltransferase involved in cell wall biosynthesis